MVTNSLASWFIASHSTANRGAAHHQRKPDLFARYENNPDFRPTVAEHSLRQVSDQIRGESAA